MMRVPSLIRLPKYKTFEYTPRHYDPVKEEIEERTRRIRSELNEERAEGDYVSTISGAFKRKTEKPSSGTYSAGLVQLLIAVLLMGAFLGYLFYGNQVLYVLLLGVPAYLYFRVKGMRSKKKPR